MRTDPRPIEFAAGADERLLAAPNYAREIVNFRWNPGGWWINDRGWEPQIPRPADYAYPAETLAPIRGLWIWTRHQGAEVYYLFERAGKLQYEWGNDNQGAETNQVVLAENRAIPALDDPGTQMIPFGRFALFLNGTDGPIKFFGGSFVTPFGFPTPPAPPEIRGVDPEIADAQFTADPDTEFGGDSNVGVANGTSAIAYVGVQAVGDPVIGNVSSFSYRVRWLTDTGSISPASAEATVRWEQSSLLPLSFGVYLTLPIGPDNVVARLVERTKNQGDGSDLTDRSFYSVAMIPDNCSDAWVDSTPDSRLTIAAPSASASGPLPPGLRFGAAFDGRLWLGGGIHAPTTIYYSERTAPEQFPVFNFLDLGGDSGEITALRAHEGRLYVFRSRGIDVVELTQELQYRATSVSAAVGTTATNTIRAVPGWGLVFLSRDGFYSLSGLDQPRRISTPIEHEIQRVGATSLARAVADWSTREGEYWCSYPADGAAENARGAVLHAYASAPDAPAWTLRHVTPTDAATGQPATGAGQFRLTVTALAADPDGWFVFGQSPIDVTTGDYPGTTELDDLAVDNVIEGSTGLQVWSARPAAGTVLTVTAINAGESYETSRADADPLEASWQSPWLHFETRTNVVHVDVWMLNTGRPAPVFEYAHDGRAEWTEGTEAEMAPIETVGKSTSDHVYGVDAYAIARGYGALWGTAVWREDRMVRVRWDVHPAVGGVGSFSFRLRATSPIGILQYQVGGKGGPIRTWQQAGATGGVG